jgi:hypothetical protein
MMTSIENQETSYLTLGWQVNSSLAPRYWVNPEAQVGMQSDQDLVLVPTDTLGSHTAIVAQSGSGKSFFLGRLIEETLLQSKARCVIVDPNADFRRVSEVVNPNRWRHAKYDHGSGKGYLPHEKSAEEFIGKWSLIKTKVFGGPELPKESGVQLRLPWNSLSVEFLAEDVAPMLRGGLYHCHEFVKALAVLLELKQAHKLGRGGAGRNRAAESVNLIDEANKLLKRLRLVGAEQERKDFLASEFSPDGLAQLQPRFGFFSLVFSLNRFRRSREQIQQHVATAAAAVEYISDDIAKYYFGKAKEYAAQHIVETEIGQLEKEVTLERLQVIDLPSFPDQKTRSLALNSILSTIWETAREDWADAVKSGVDQRVPTFIVVDEAHNLIPAQPRGLGAEALREQFRAIAAEGRKYGLFLIVCTQRPDKIDPLVLSECENKALMRLGSRSVLEIAEKLLGLEDVPAITLRKCLEFEKGRAMLMGRWSKDGPQILYSAMRRTIEGGTSLSDTHWATPEAAEPKDQKSSATRAQKRRPKKKVKRSKKAAKKA